MQLNLLNQLRSDHEPHLTNHDFFKDRSTVFWLMKENMCLLFCVRDRSKGLNIIDTSRRYFKFNQLKHMQSVLELERLTCLTWLNMPIFPSEISMAVSSQVAHFLFG